MSFELSQGTINLLIYLALIIAVIKLLPAFIAEHSTKNAVGFLIACSGLIGVSFADMMNNLSAARILGSTNDSVMAYKAGITKSVKNVAIIRPQIIVVARGPQTTDLPPMPTAIGNNPKVVVMVVERIGRSRRLPAFISE